MSSATVVVPPASKQQKLSTGKRARNGQEIVIDAEHARAINARPCWTQTVMAPAPATSALNNTAFFSFILENNQSGAIHDATLRFRVTFTTASNNQPSDSRVLPTTLWWDRIEYIDRLTGTEIARYHGDMMHLTLNTLSQEALDAVCDMVNMCPKTGKVSGRQWEHGDEQFFYLPLVHTWLNGMDLELATLRGDLEIRFYPRGSIFVASQSGQAVPCTASLNEISFLAGCTQLPNGLRLGRHPHKLGKVAEQKYIDYVQYTQYGVRIRPSNRVAIDLDQFSHHSGALFMFIRKSGDQTAYGDATTYFPQHAYDTNGRLLTYESFGNDTTIDLEDIHGRSQLGEGTPIDHRFFQEETMGQLMRDSYLRANSVYMIPFTNSPKAMLDGVMDGYKTFVGNRERLVINTGLAPRQTTATFVPPTLVGWAASQEAKFVIKYDGVTVLSASLDNDNPDGVWTKVGPVQYTGEYTSLWTNVNNALAASPVLREMGVKLSFRNADTTMTYTSAVNVVATFRDLDDQPLICDREDLAKLSLEIMNSGAADKTYEAYTCTTCVAGRPGVIEGLYDITIYSAYFKYLHEANGSLEVAAV